MKTIGTAILILCVLPAVGQLHANILTGLPVCDPVCFVEYQDTVNGQPIAFDQIIVEWYEMNYRGVKPKDDGLWIYTNVLVDSAANDKVSQDALCRWSFVNTYAAEQAWKSGLYPLIELNVNQDSTPIITDNGNEVQVDYKCYEVINPWKP